MGHLVRFAHALSLFFLFIGGFLMIGSMFLGMPYHAIETGKVVLPSFIVWLITRRYCKLRKHDEHVKG